MATTIRSRQLHLHFNHLCRLRRLCHILIALKKTPAARRDLHDGLTRALGKLQQYTQKMTPSTNMVIFYKQLTYLQLATIIDWFVNDEDDDLSSILGTDFDVAYNELIELNTVRDDDDAALDIKAAMKRVAHIFTGIYYTTSSLQQQTLLRRGDVCPSCVNDLNHYGIGRKHNLCNNDPDSDPELPSMSFVNVMHENICVHLISNEEITPFVFLLKHMDDDTTA